MYKRVIVLTIVVAGILLVTTPAKAFYLELPNVLKFWQGSAKAQEGGIIAPAPAPFVDQQQPAIAPVSGESITVSQPQPQSQLPQTCMVNGKEMPGSCDQYNSQLNNYQQMQDDGENGDKDQQMQQQNQERQMKDMKRGVNDMLRNLKEFDRAIKNITIPQEIKDKLQTAKDSLNAAKNAATVEEMGDISGLNDTIRELDDYRREVVENAQRLDGLKRGMKGMTQGIKSFESQVNRLIKQKIIVPITVTEDLAKIKTMMEAVKNAKTYEEAEAAGVDEMQDLMQNLNENRQQLEMLARWPQTLKQLERELKNLDRQLKRDKIVVDRLIKKEIDLTANYEGFVAAIAKLKAVKDDAVAKMAAGDSEGAFDAIESDFFGQMEDVWQFDKVIQTMNNLGRFKSDFRRRVTQADSMIKKLVRAKKDVSEAKEALAQVKDKGNEILEMIKIKDVDEDALMSALSEMEDLSQAFEDAISELTGESDDMPWEQGPQQFRQVQMPASVSRNLPQKTMQTQQTVQQQSIEQPVNNVVVQ